MATDVELDSLQTNTRPSPGSTFLSHAISDDYDAQKAIVEGLWELIEPSPRGLASEKERWAERLTNLSEYFESYRQHFVDLEHLTGKNITVAQANQIIVYWKKVLADNATISRETLTSELAGLREHHKEALTQPGNNVGLSPQHTISATTSDALSPDIAGTKDKQTKATNTIVKLPESVVPEALYTLGIDNSLSASVRAVFGICLDPNPVADGLGAVFGQSTSTTIWHASTSLSDFIASVFPKHEDIDSEPILPVRSSMLRARHLEKHAGVQIDWTNHLPDHLSLRTTKNSKTLRIFALPSLLEVAYESALLHGSSGNGFDEELPESLSQGRMPPSFLYETLMTYRLLFPIRDRHWLELKLKRTSSPQQSWTTHIVQVLKSYTSLPRKSRTLLCKPFDPRLTNPVDDWHRSMWYNRPLTTRRELFTRFPHWGVRLHILLEEAADPSPITRLGRWSERRKGPRHAFWVTVAAFVLAVVLGMLALGLAVMQFWVGMCDWQGDETGRSCGIKKGNG